MKENKEYEITKSSRTDWIGVTFQCHIINKGVNVAPKWFQEFKKENDVRWTKQQEFNKYVGDFIKKQEEFNKAQLEFNRQQTKFNNRVNDFMEQQVAFNTQQTEFNKHVLDVFGKNNIE